MCYTFSRTQERKQKTMDVEYLKEKRILLVDDEQGLLDMVCSILKEEGYRQIRTAGTVKEALEAAAAFRPELAILDVMLPDGDGFSLFRDLRTFTQVPVLFLSARDEDEARLRGLGLGADDYITKPFLPREMTLRLGAVLRRTYGTAGEGGVIYLGPVTVDMETGVVSGNGPDRTLTAKEYALLSALNENRGRIVTVDALCMAAWRGENMGYENTLMVHMRRLREKIEPDPSHPRYLVTVRGLGYRLLKEDGR